MSFGDIVQLLFLIFVVILFGRFVSIIFYRLFSFILLRVLIGGVLIFAFFITAFGNYKWEIAVAILLIASEYLKHLYLYQKDFKYNILDTIKFLLGMTAKAGMGLIHIPSGVKNAKQKLQEEREEFENEKRKIQEENEKIMKAWEELFKAREEFERYKSDGNGQQQDYSQNKSYQERKQQYDESKRKENKQNTGRLFQEWAKFDIEDPANNTAHEVLGVSLNSTPSEIKKARNKLAMKWMPDHLKHWAKTTEEIEEGLKIAQMINIAYEKMMKGR